MSKPEEILKQLELMYIRDHETEERYLSFCLFSGLKPDVAASAMTALSTDILTSAMTAIASVGREINVATVWDNLQKTDRLGIVGGAAKLSEMNSYGRDLPDDQAEVLKAAVLDKGIRIVSKNGDTYAIIKLEGPIEPKQ